MLFMEVFVMKMRRLLAFFLALTLMLATVALTSCEDNGEAVTTGAGSSDAATSVGTASEGASNGSDGSTASEDANEDPDESGAMTEEQWQALIAAIEKSAQSENYTLNATLTGKQSSLMPGEGSYYCEIQSMVETERVEGDKRESKNAQTARYSPDGEWVTETTWTFKEFTSEDAGISYHWDEETESWERGEFSYESNDSAADNFMGQFEEVYRQMHYDETTGIYSLAEYNADDTAMEFIFARPMEIESGGATARYRNIEIELRDGYVYRFHSELEVRADITAVYEGEQISMQAEMIQNQTAVFSDYGTTVVTLPVVDEIVED